MTGEDMGPGDAPTPAARTDGLIVERLPGELLVYDEERDEAHCLHAEAAAVFDLADGSHTSAEIAALASEHLPKPVSEARVAEVLAELGARHLLDDDGAAGEGLSRRDLIHRGALTGAGVAGAALITSIAAPVPAAAQSPNGECQTGGTCDPEPAFPTCGGGECFCAQTTDGPQCAAADPTPCETLTPCESSGDCGQNEFCAVNTCCGPEGVCVPACGASQTQTQTQRLGKGSTAFRR
jgi:hypothetical protein